MVREHEHKPYKEVGHWPYIAMVAIVAIVAVAFLVMNFSGSFSGNTSEETTLVVDEEGNLVGEAQRMISRPGYAMTIASGFGMEDIRTSEDKTRDREECRSLPETRCNTCCGENYGCTYIAGDPVVKSRNRIECPGQDSADSARGCMKSNCGRVIIG